MGKMMLVLFSSILNSLLFRFAFGCVVSTLTFFYFSVERSSNTIFRPLFTVYH